MMGTLVVQPTYSSQMKIRKDKTIRVTDNCDLFYFMNIFFDRMSYQHDSYTSLVLAHTIHSCTVKLLSVCLKPVDTGNKNKTKYFDTFSP